MASKFVRTLIYSRETLKNLSIVSAVYGFQALIHNDLFRCPCRNNKFYGLAFLLAPAIFLLGLSVMICSRSRSVMMNCVKYNDYKTKCNYFLSSLVHFFHPLLAPVAWIVIGMLRGDYFACILGGPREVFSPDEEKTKLVYLDQLRAQSFIIGSASLVAVVIFATGIVCIQECCTNNSRPLPTLDDLIQLKNKALVNTFDEKTKEVAREYAKKLVESSFCVRDLELGIDQRFVLARDKVMDVYGYKAADEFMVDCSMNDLQSVEFTSSSTM